MFGKILPERTKKRISIIGNKTEQFYLAAEKLKITLQRG